MDRLIVGLIAVLLALAAGASESNENIGGALAQGYEEQSQTYAKIRQTLGESEAASQMHVVSKSTVKDSDFQIQLVQQKPRKRIYLVKNYKK